MKTDLAKYAVSNLIHRKLRSFLSVLSILIGIMAIFAILSFGLGLKSYINSLAEEMGKDRIIVQPRGFAPPGATAIDFTEDEVSFTEKINGVSMAAGVYFDYAELGYKDYKKKIAGTIAWDKGETSTMIEQTFAFKIAKGRNLKKGDVDKIVLGHYYSLPDKTFPRAILLGDKVTINGKQFEVIGFVKELGNRNDDEQIFVTPEGLEFYKGTKPDYGFIILDAQDGVDPELVADRVNDRLRKKRGQKEGKEDFYAQTFDDIIKTFNTIINGLWAVLAIVGLISVVVAAVNTMNTMYTAVLERTKEIGVFKAIGARNSDIFFVFVFEAGVLGLLGGLIGVGLGYLIASAGGAAAAASGFALLQPAFPWWLTAGCLTFSFLVGAISGFSPALQAARQKPVDALRYE